MRLALFGGTFDPPHRGHLAIATAAADAFQLDSVLFSPAGRQPLKFGQPPTPYLDRLAMTAAACTADRRFSASELDAPHPGGTPNYTVETLQALRNLHPHARLFNLVGADAFLTLPQWREPHRLLELAEWIVVTRPGSPMRTEAGLTRLALSLSPRAHVHLLDSVADEVSATALRRRLQEGDPCTGLIPPRVAAYIQTAHLYL